MKLTSRFFSLIIATLVGLMGLVACGGTDPNNSVTASAIPTCKLNANWQQMQKGLSIKSVHSILGLPDRKVVDGGKLTYTYEKCRQFAVEATPEDLTTTTIERVILIYPTEGIVTFDAELNGYVQSFTSPPLTDKTYFHEFTEAEKLGLETFDSSYWCRPTNATCYGDG